MKTVGDQACTASRQLEQQTSSGAGRHPEGILWGHLGQHHSFLLEKRFIAFMGYPLAVQVLACLCVPERDRVFRVTEFSTTSNTANQIVGGSEPSEPSGQGSQGCACQHSMFSWRLLQLPLTVVSDELLDSLEEEEMEERQLSGTFLQGYSSWVQPINERDD